MLSRDTSGLDPHSRTAERWRILRDAGAQLDIVVSSSKVDEWQEEGIHVRGTGGSTLWTRLRRLYRFGRTQCIDCDMITAQDPFELGLIAFRLAKTFRKKWEIQDHGGFFDGKKSDEPLWVLRKRLALFLVRRADGIRTVSPGSLANLQRMRLRGSPYFLPIAVHDRFLTARRNPDPDLIVTVARFVSVKRLHLLVSAFAEFKKNRPAAKLVIIGRGPLESELRRQVRDAHLEDSVRFETDPLIDPLTFLERATAFVLPSSHEGWGVAAIEAAIVGVPVVMADTGCARWLEERGRALVFKTQHTHDLASLMLQAERIDVSHPIDHVLSSKKSAEEQGGAWKRLIDELPRTLICIQAVDERDPLMGFAISWFRTFAQRSRAIVCALRIGAFPAELEDRIEVRPLRSNGGTSKVEAALRLLSVAWSERFRYDSVFIRGDAQYLVLCGWLWKLLGKKIVFWYTHYTATSFWFWLGVPWCDRVVTAVDESNPLQHALKIGHHIDTMFFRPERDKKTLEIPRVLILGRVSQVKRVSWMAKALWPFVSRNEIQLRIIGKATDKIASAELKEVLRDQGIWDERDMIQSEVAELYSHADIFVNATPGSMDKTILEAAASGVIVLAATKGLLHGLPQDLHWLQFNSSDELQRALERVIALSVEERRGIGERLRRWVMDNHSMEHHLDLLIPLLSHHPVPRPMRQVLKHAAMRLFPSKESNGIAVLMFHFFDGKGVIGFDIDRFSETVQLLKANGYSFHRMADIWNGQSWNVPSRGKHAIITIDDGTEDVWRILPVLRSCNIPVVLAPVAEVSTLTTSDGFTRRVLPASEVKALVESGYVEIIGHGARHVHLTELQDGELRQELLVTLKYIKQFRESDQNPLVIAYPRGRGDVRVSRLAQQVGFVGGLSTRVGRWNQDTDPFFIPRYPVLYWMHPSDIVRECSGKGDCLRALLRSPWNFLRTDKKMGQ